MKAHYDALYKEREEYFGTLPSPVALIVQRYCKNGTVLDIGCGQGRDALYFARKGFSVTAMDISSVAVEQLRRRAQGLPMTVLEQDMNDLPDGPFAVVFSNFSLQMIEPKRRGEYLDRLKERYPDAIHAHSIPINGACFGERFICDDTLLSDAYRDWEILFSEDSWSTARNRDGEPFLMRASRIIARRRNV